MGSSAVGGYDDDDGTITGLSSSLLIQFVAVVESLRLGIDDGLSRSPTESETENTGRWKRASQVAPTIEF